MQGSLADVAPAELCLRLAGQAASGRLRLRSAAGEATLQFDRGELVSARAPATSGTRGARLGERLVHAGRLDRADLDRVLEDQRDAGLQVSLGSLLVQSGLVPRDLLRLFLLEQLLESLLETVGWFDGTFEFTPSASPAPASTVELSVPVDRALREVRRRVAEADRVRQLVPSGAMVPQVVEGAGIGPNLGADTFTVLSNIDGRKSVTTIASMLGYSVSEVSRIVYGLVLQGHLEPADEDNEGGAPSPVPELPAAFDQAADTDPEPDTPEPSVAMDQIDVLETPAPAPAAAAWSDQPVPASSAEPEPWVGFAHGGHEDVAVDAPAPARTTPPVSVPTSPTTDPASVEVPTPVSPAAQRSLDDVTRRELFSELHDVSAWRPMPPNPEPSPTPAASAEPDPADPADPEPADEPAKREGPNLSGAEVSGLLAELHALNNDED